MPKDKPYQWESKKEADIRISNAMPTVNAMDRSQIFPDETEYNEGGKV